MLTSIELLVYGSLIGIMMIWVLLPLVPAVCIYRYFPDTTVSISGPLSVSNLKINASGAFAGYLVLFIILIPFVNLTYNTIGNFMRPYWVIKGKISILDKDQKEVHYQDLFQNITFKTQPETNSFQDPVF